jgi:poly(glycerol-phosphate) alpha-glucosyltransferase
MFKTANLTGSVSRNAGGLYESVRRLVQSLATTGMEVRVFGIEDEHTAADIGAWSPVPVQAFPIVGPRQFGFSPRFRRALEGFSPDLLHTHGLWLYPSIASNHYRRRRHVPRVVSAHGMLDPWAIRNSRWKKVIANFLYEGAHLREAACLRALCESEANSIRQFGLKNPIAIIPNGIDLPDLKDAEILKNETVKSGEQKVDGRNAPWRGYVEPGQKVLLFLSRIHPKKGLVNLIKAWVEFQNTEDRGHKSEWVLAIAGWDQDGHEAELKRLCAGLRIPFTDVRDQTPSSIPNAPASVIFLGPQFKEAKAACYAHCDGFILPSFSEGVPMVVLEAWAYCKPVLMTPECNLPAGFARGAAIRIEPSAESILQGLREFVQASSDQRRTLGENGLRLTREQFAWPVLGREMADLYQWLLGGGTKPGCVI